eukprot:TRINITY_DN6467_c0_g2_i2.p1 TRINITY_DN6467_c0_g2~~TRINITY_DN6467_c0_g2_i2.p1  ORF type:complete len:598 (-),score=102.98 TRINITY_DN6467_c0_g2_i2:24-1667(-)
MRRRAMSHNPYLVSAKHRPRAFREMKKSGSLPQKSKKSKYRTQKRRINRLDRDYTKRQEGKLWLPTHIWHAKRFHMINKWGYRIAKTTTNKGARAAYRGSKNESVLYDSSYLIPIQISGEEDKIISFMRGVSSSECRSVGNFLYINGTREGEISICDIDGNLVCPVKFFWKPKSQQSDRILFLWIHPSSLNDVRETLDCFDSDGIKISYKDREFSRFELIGPKSGKVLRNILSEVESSQDMRLEKCLSVRPSSLPSGAILGLTVHDPRIKRNTRKRNIKSNPRHFLNWSEEWSQSSWDSPEHIMQLQQKNINDPDTPISDLESSISQVLLVQIPGNNNSYGSGWAIHIHHSWSMAFWTSLVYAGGRAIGLDEHRHIHFEKGRLYFPFDYPSTKAYKNEAAFTSSILEELWLKKPKSKRVNYEKLNILSPFQIPWDIQFGPYEVWSKPLGELDEATKEELQNSATRLLIPVLYWLDNGGTLLKEMARIYLKGEVVGFVTSAAYSFQYGKCKGVGYCCSTVFDNNNFQNVKIRNITSQFYHDVNIQPIL